MNVTNDECDRCSDVENDNVHAREPFVDSENENMCKCKVKM